MKYKPMLCKTGTKKDLYLKNYIYEPKLDGTRALCYKNKKQLKFINRRKRDISFKYPEFDFIKNINAENCVLDGEIIVYDKKGNPNFNLLQKREQIDKKILIEIRSKQYPATYVVFDILEKNNKKLINSSLLKRKKILENTIKESQHLQKIFYTTNGKKLWNIIKKRKTEGVVAKRKNSKYFPGKRKPAWLKIKFLKTIDCVITGYTHKKRTISALVLGIYDQKKLKYLGKVGTGFSEKFLAQLKKDLDKIKTKKALLEYKGNEKVNWVKPEFVCEVQYLEISKNKIMRAPVFLRLRNDKPVKECVLKEQI